MAASSLGFEVDFVAAEEAVCVLIRGVDNSCKNILPVFGYCGCSSVPGHQFHGGFLVCIH